MESCADDGIPKAIMSVPDQITQPENDMEIEIEPAMDSKAISHDSMVTVRLSEPPTLSVDTVLDPRKSVEDRRQTQEVTLLKNTTYVPDEEEEQSPRITMVDPNGDVMSPSGSNSVVSGNGESRRGSYSSEESAEGVNWEELEKTEEQEPRDESSDDVSRLHSNLRGIC